MRAIEKGATYLAGDVAEKLSCRKSIRVGSRCMRFRARNTTAELMGAHTRQRKMPWHTGHPRTDSERGGDGDAGGDDMKIGDITATLAQKAVVNVIYKEWLHEGHIDIEHTEDFRCVIDGKLYEITVREVGKEAHQ